MEDERSRETTEFRENDPAYLVAIFHIKYVSICIALFSLLAIVGSFGAGISFFPWANYDTTFDVIVTGFVIYAMSGILVHIALLHSVQNTDSSLAIPFILYHCFLVALEAITSLIAVGELVSDQANREGGDQAARITLFISPFLIFLETMMVYSIFKLRTYLRAKRRFIRHGLPPPLREVVSVDNIGFRIGSNSNPSISPEPPATAPNSTTVANETDSKQENSA